MEEESDFKQKKITIIGLGLIGSSLGLALKKGFSKFKVCGIDKPGIMEEAIMRGVVDEIQYDLQRGLSGADIVIIATPIKTILNLFSEIKPFLKEGCLITDTGSTKAAIMEEAEKIFNNQFEFIGGHPLAGLERGGVENASAELFQDKPYFVIPKKGNKVSSEQKMASLINCIGAREIKIEAQDHDRFVALVSHLPQLIAVILTNIFGLWINEEGERSLYKINGNTFREMTRVASSPFSIWKDIFETNTANTVYFLEELEKSITAAKNKLRYDSSALAEDFKAARLIKEEMSLAKMKK